MAFRDKPKTEPTSSDATAPTFPTPDAQPSVDSGSSSSSSSDAAPATDVAPSTHPNGEQSVDRAEDKVLPASNPDEIAPIVDAAGNSTAAPKPAPSTTGYRVAPGKSISGGNGDALDAGAEIGEQHVVGGDKRLEELVKAGYVVKTEKKSEGDGSKPEPHGVDGTKGEPSK